MRWPPYSRGKRNCRSAEQKWEDVTATARRAIPVSTNSDASPSVWAIVEHAPYCPKKGIPRLRRPKVEEIHWFNRSPARM